MTHRRSIPLLRMAVLVAVGWFAGARIADATCPGVCTPTFDPFGAVVGCCKADCTYKTGSSTARECISSTNPCQQGHCNETSHVCEGGWVNPDGHPACLSQTDTCKVGECFNQACTYIDNKVANGFDDFCDDDKVCTTDSCTESANQYTAPTCSHSNVAPLTPCTGNPGGECTVGKCSADQCVNYPAPDGTDCSTADGDTCHPKYCQVGVCTPNGADITCPIPGNPALGVCRIWHCGWSGSNPSCTQVFAPTTQSCDTNSHDCKAQMCRTNGSCGNQGEAINHVCDPNFTTPLSDCTTGVCDARHNCTGITYDPDYDGVACTDSNVCTTASACDHDTASCRGTACAANTVDCPACNVGNCDPTKGIPNCGCP